MCSIAASFDLNFCSLLNFVVKYNARYCCKILGENHFHYLRCEPKEASTVKPHISNNCCHLIFFPYHRGCHPSAENLITLGCQHHDGTTCHMNLWQKVSVSGITDLT